MGLGHKEGLLPSETIDQAVPGRKSDWLDCQWLQKLHTYGLLAKALGYELVEHL